MIKPIVFLLAGILPLSSASGQRLEASRFSHRAEGRQLSQPVAFAQQPSSRCQRSGLKFLGQFLAGAGTGFLSGLALTAVADPRDYGDYSRPGGGADGGSSTFVRHVMLAGAAGASLGVWLVARRSCGHLVPALIGASIPTLLFWSYGDENPGPLAVAGVLVFIIPIQALSATVAQTIVR
jgi:hypothetical protein